MDLPMRLRAVATSPLPSALDEHLNLDKEKEYDRLADAGSDAEQNLDGGGEMNAGALLAHPIQLRGWRGVARCTAKAVASTTAWRLHFMSTQEPHPTAMILPPECLARQLDEVQGGERSLSARIHPSLHQGDFRDLMTVSVRV